MTKNKFILWLVFVSAISIVANLLGDAFFKENYALFKLSNSVITSSLFCLVSYFRLKYINYKTYLSFVPLLHVITSSWLYVLLDIKNTTYLELYLAPVIGLILLVFIVLLYRSDGTTHKSKGSDSIDLEK